MWEYEVQGLYEGEWEMVTTESTKEEAKATKAIYEANEPNAFRVRRVRSEA